MPLPIEGERASLWLFGDSFVAGPGTTAGRSYPFVHNSIGLSRCDPGGVWRLETDWGKGASGTPRAFFEPAPEADWVRLASQKTGGSPWYWPFDGFVAHDVLFVALLRVVEAEPRGPFRLPFRVVGVDLARIENFRERTRDWRIQISTLSDSTAAFPASAFVRTAEHVYVWAFFDQEAAGSPRILARFPLEALREWRPDLSGDLEYLAKDSEWKPGFVPANAKALMKDDASEMSVHFDARLGSWLAVYSAPAPVGAGSDGTKIWIRRAPGLEGPWSEREALFAIPELTADSEGDVDEHRFCYAGKAHPQFARPGELLVTYVCNLFATKASETGAILERLRVEPSLYRPRAVPIGVPGGSVPQRQ